MMWGYGYGPYGGMGFWPVIGWVFSLIIPIFIIFAMIRLLRGPHHWHDQDRSLEILRERYAKGEITKKEFEEMKKDLQ
jgi:putative membrane protein